MAKTAKRATAKPLRKDLKDLLAQFPINAQDQTWSHEAVASDAADAAQRIFDKHVKGQIDRSKVTDNASHGPESDRPAPKGTFTLNGQGPSLTGKSPGARRPMPVRSRPHQRAPRLRG